MKPSVSLDRAKAIIQAWYNEYCRVYEKPNAPLDVKEEEEKVSGAYKVTNPKNGTSTLIFWSTVSDYESSQSTGGIPGDLIGNIWDAFSDLG